MEDEVKEFMEVISAEEIPIEEVKKEFEGLSGLNLPEPSLVHYWRDHGRRVIWIDSAIEEDIIGLARNIVRWNYEDRDIPVEEREPIKLFINSPGGVLIPTMAVCDAILSSTTPVYGINMHEAASAAAFIFICCHRRVAMPNAYFLLHLGSGGTGGTFQQSRAQQEDYNHHMNAVISMLEKRLNIDDKEEFERLIDGEWYLYMDTTDGSKSDARRFNLITDEDPTMFWK